MHHAGKDHWEFLVITPEQAREWLGTSTQRRLQEDKVQKYLDLMLSGQWDPHQGSSPIRFKENSGRLADGNHRLHALVRYGKPLVMAVRRKHG